MAEITSQVDFLSDQQGQAIRVVTQPGLKNFSDMAVTPKEVELLRNQSPKIAEMLTGKLQLEDLKKDDDGAPAKKEGSMPMDKLKEGLTKGAESVKEAVKEGIDKVSGDDGEKAQTENCCVCCPQASITKEC